MLWIKNTLDLGEVEASTAYLEMAEMRDNLEILVGPRQLELGPTATSRPSTPSRAKRRKWSPLIEGKLHVH